MTVTDRLLVALVVLATFVPSIASAEPSPADRVVAQSAFDDARELFDRGEIARACEKFAVSRALDPKIGTVMNHAICLERLGKIASAYAALGEAESLARREGRTSVAKDAAARAQALVGRLPRLRLRVDPTVAEIAIDGAHLDHAAWTVDVPLDPGEHVVRAEAPSRKASETVAAMTEGKVTTLAVGPLAEEARAPEPKPTAPPPPAKPNHTPALIVGAAGLGLAAVGGTFGVLATAKRGDAEDACRAGDCARGEALNDDARTFAWAANIGLGLGVAAIVAGIVLWVRAPRAHADGALRVRF